MESAHQGARHPSRLTPRASAQGPSALSAGKVPDPRRYGALASAHPFNQMDAHELRRALQSALAERRDAELDEALRAAPTREAYLRLWNAVCDAVHRPDPDPAAISTRVFALPLVIVAGSSRPALLAGVLPDIAALAALFGQHGVLGKTKNFGFSNALCALETLEQVAAGEVYAWTQPAAAAPRELAPAPLAITGPGEQVYLRFLVGAGIVNAAESSFVETASNIGAWGMPLTRALALQLAQPGVDALPLPRPPLDLLRAAHAGRCAQLEAAFNLFVSNALRRFRMSVGDPVAVISAHDDGDLRVGFSSPFDDALVEGFRWPLHALDDIGHITTAIAELLAECHVADANYLVRVLPALDEWGQVWFASVRELDSLIAGQSRH